MVYFGGVIELFPELAHGLWMEQGEMVYAALGITSSRIGQPCANNVAQEKGLASQ